MFTNGYNIRSQHYKLLRNRYIAEGYFDKAKQCISLEYKFKHTELDALRDLAKSTNEFANLIKVRKGGDRTGVGQHGMGFRHADCAARGASVRSHGECVAKHRGIQLAELV